MKACVFGAGAVGGSIATRLLAAGADDVSVVARGAQLEAMRSRGLVLRSGGTEVKAAVPVATDDPSTLPNAPSRWSCEVRCIALYGDAKAFL